VLLRTKPALDLALELDRALALPKPPAEFIGFIAAFVPGPGLRAPGSMTAVKREDMLLFVPAGPVNRLQQINTPDYTQKSANLPNLLIVKWR